MEGGGAGRDLCLQHCSHVAAEQKFTRTALAWASAHRDKWGQLHPLMENGWKIKKRKHAEKSSFLCLCYILRAIRTGRCTCRERRYSDQIFIQMYFRMHHFVVKFSKFSSPQAARGIDPPNQNPADVPVLWRKYRIHGLKQVALARSVNCVWLCCCLIPNSSTR